MAGQIRITPETMRQRAGEVRVQGNNFQEVIDRTHSIINELQSEWEGQASHQFAQQFERLKPSFNEMRELLYQLSKQLDGTAEALEQLDQDIAGRFSR